jgi:hypothetical protein
LFVAIFAWFAFLCVFDRPLPNWLLNSSIPRSLAGRYGVSYSLGSLRVECFPLAVEVQDAEITFDLSGRVGLKLERPLAPFGFKDSKRARKISRICWR